MYDYVWSVMSFQTNLYVFISSAEHKTIDIWKYFNCLCSQWKLVVFKTTLEYTDFHCMDKKPEMFFFYLYYLYLVGSTEKRKSLRFEMTLDWVKGEIIFVFIIPRLWWLCLFKKVSIISCWMHVLIMVNLLERFCPVLTNWMNKSRLCSRPLLWVCRSVYVCFECVF